MNNNLFTEEQMEQIVLGKGEDLDVNVYTKSEFTAKEMEQIRLGLKSGVDVSIYAKPVFNAHQMEWIRKGLEIGLDMNAYAKPEYTAKYLQDAKYYLEKYGFMPNNFMSNDDSLKLDLFFKAYEEGIDLSKFMGVEHTYHKLCFIKKILELDPTFDNFNYTYKQLEEIVNGLQEGVDVRVYAKPEYSPIEMKTIREALKNGLDMKKYLERGYEYFQLKEIFQGKKNGVDISAYSNIKFDHLQMEQIRLGLEEGVDISVYAKPEFNSFQMIEIRIGLLEKFDVSVYAKPEIDWRAMNMIRHYYNEYPIIMSLVEKGLSYEQLHFCMENIDWFEDIGWFTYATDPTLISVMSEFDYPDAFTFYVTQGFNREQLKEINLGWEDGIYSDVPIYAKKEFSAKQMEQIRLGLEEGFNVKEFAKPSISAENMESIRLDLRLKLYRYIYSDIHEVCIANEMEFINEFPVQLVYMLKERADSGDKMGARKLIRDWKMDKYGAGSSGDVVTMNLFDND